MKVKNLKNGLGDHKENDFKIFSQKFCKPSKQVDFPYLRDFNFHSLLNLSLLKAKKWFDFKQDLFFS